MKSLLFLAHRIPFPPTKGDKVRSYNELKYLVRYYKVYLGAFVDDEADFAHEAALREMCEGCHLVRLSPKLARVRSLVGLLTGEALTLPYYRSARMRHWVDDILRTRAIDGILVFSAAMAQYVMTADKIRRVADLVDVDSDKWRQYAVTKPWPYAAIYNRESRTLLHYESRVCEDFDSTVLVSAHEAELFRKLVPAMAAKVRHINNGVDCEYFSPLRAYLNPYKAGERVIVFTGAMDYWPNVEAVIWFVHEVFPKIRAQCADVLFYIVGIRPSPEVRRLADLPGVRVTGGVPDVRPFIAHAKFAVAPLRLARGVQNKVLEAMAMGKTVLASPQAAEGIDAEAGVEFLIAADANAFVELASRLFNDPDRLGASIGSNARAKVLETYSWESSLVHLKQLLGDGASSSYEDASHSSDLSRVVGAGSAR